MLGVETYGTRAASAKTLLTKDDIVLKVFEAVPYLTFFTHVTFFLVEIFLHRGIPIPIMDIVSS